MRFVFRLMAATCVMVSTMAHATLVTSGCLTVTAVVNQESGNAVTLALSPAILGCTPNSTPGVEFAISVNGVTASNLNSFLASGFAALAIGRQVMVIYDDSTIQCYGMFVAVGGFHGEC